MIFPLERCPQTVRWFAFVILLFSTNRSFADPIGEAFFEKSIRPILVERCVSCHGPKVQKAGLRLDSRAAAIEGGTDGPAIVPGKPIESRSADCGTIEE